MHQEIAAIIEQNESVEDEIRAEKEAKAEKKKEAAERKEAKKQGQSFTPRAKRSDDPNVIYGRDFEDEPMELSQVLGEMGEITFRGQVTALETREIKNERTILIFTVTDFTDSITVKIFVKNEQLADILGELKAGAFFKIKGVTNFDKYDNELGIASVYGIKKIPDFRTFRKDTYQEKRVELHCHTKMSDMDGVSDPKSIVKLAHDWGHKAVAITDHGVVQAFPDVNHYIEDLAKANPEDPFKVIYGVEAYLVDDLKDIAINEKGQNLRDTFVVFDLETTGFSAIKDKIIEIGAVKVKNGEIVDRFSTFVNPGRPIPYEVSQLTGIRDDMVLDAPPIETVLGEFLEFIGEAALVAHRAKVFPLVTPAAASFFSISINISGLKDTTVACCSPATLKVLLAAQSITQ